MYIYICIYALYLEINNYRVSNKSIFCLRNLKTFSRIYLKIIYIHFNYLLNLLEDYLYTLLLFVGFKLKFIYDLEKLSRLKY